MSQDLLTAPPPGLVWAFRFDGEGRATQIAADAPLGRTPDDWFWFHLNLADTRARAWILAADALPEFARETLVEVDDHPVLHVEEAALHGVIADLVQAFQGPTEEIGFLRFAVTERLVVTARRQPLQGAEATRRALDRGLSVTTTAALFETIMEHVADGFERLAGDAAKALDRLEERILADAFHDDTSSLGRMRLMIVRLHRQLADLRGLFHRLEREEEEAANPALHIAAGRLAQRLDSLDHEIVAMQAKARLLQEEMSAKIAAETNRHLYVLSVVTALLLPPSLIAGLFGMNLKGVMFAEHDDGFWWGVMLAATSAAAVYLFLRRRGILG